jgi:hypothetical protein
VFGFLLTFPHISFIIAVLHFIAVVLLTHIFCEAAEVGSVITSVWVGVILPFLIEVWHVVRLFIFKTDFYYIRE